MFDIHDDDIFSGCPVQKWKEIIFHSNRGLAEDEIERILEQLALCELLLDELEPNWEQKIAKLSFSHESAINNRKNNLAIDSMGKILTQSE